MSLETTPSLFEPGEPQTIFSFVEHGHQFIFVVDDYGFVQACREIGKMAADPDSPLDWFDARRHIKELRDFHRLIEGKEL